MRQVKTREFAASICDLFENILDEHNINIPNEDREGNEEEAHLYGATYYDLEDSVLSLLHEFAAEIDPECKVELVDEF